jgi:GNAT superfamily N-acetyltransferase
MVERIDYDVRIARRSDNEALCALAATAAMQSDVTVSADRSPDFFAFYDQYGEMLGTAAASERDGYVCCLAVHDGRVVGTVGAAFRTVRQGGATIRIAYPMDARVIPDYQHRGVFKALWSFLRAEIDAARVDAMVGLVLRGNSRARRAARQIFPAGMLREAGDFHLVHFSMYWPYRERTGLEVETATEEDLDEVAARLETAYADHSFAPRMSRAWLDAVITRSPGFDPSQIHLVRDAGAIVALVGLWDQSQVRRLVVHRNPLHVKLGIAASHVLHAFVDSPPPPRTGEPLASCYVKQIACVPGAEETLRDLMRVLLNRIRRARRHSLVWGAFHQSDPLLGLWRGFAATRSYSRMVYVPGATGWDVPPDELSRSPAYADFSMV